MAIKTNFSVDKSIKDFSNTEKEIKPQKEIPLTETNISENEIKDLMNKIKSLKNEIKVFKDNGLKDLLEAKQAELNDLETQLKEKRKNQKFYKGNILVRLPEEKHTLYKSLAADNHIKFNQFVLLALAYTYKQIEDNKIKITDYGIETIPQI
jgi:predicted HicB family RNase H-like nuclease